MVGQADEYARPQAKGCGVSSSSLALSDSGRVAFYSLLIYWFIHSFI